MPEVYPNRYPYGMMIGMTEVFVWTVRGESFREGSSDPWRIEEHGGEVTAEGAGEALVAIITGFGAPGDNAISWDLIEQEREITITIHPKEDAA